MLVARLDIDRLEKIDDITKKGDGFDRLVLKEGYRDLVRALVETHLKEPRSGTEQTKVKHEVDLVKGKGKGLIILLHGAPVRLTFRQSACLKLWGWCNITTLYAPVGGLS